MEKIHKILGNKYVLVIIMSGIYIIVTPQNMNSTYSSRGLGALVFGILFILMFFYLVNKYKVKE